MTDSLLSIAIVGLGISLLGLLIGGSTKQLQAGNPSHLQSACVIGMGLSFGATGLSVSGIRGFGSWVLWLFMIAGITFVAVGILGYVKASKK